MTDRHYFPSIKESFIIIFVFILLCGGLLVLVFNALFGRYLSFENGLMINYVLQFIPVLTYIFMKIRRNTPEPEEKSDTARLSCIKKAGVFMSAILIVPAFCIIAEPSEIIFRMPDSLLSMMERLASGHDPRTFITLTVLPALTEEFVCRGTILKGLLHNTSPSTAIILSAVLFGVMHLNIYQAVPGILFGLAAGWIYYKSGSLMLTVMMHFLNNFISYMLLTRLPEDFPEHLWQLTGNTVYAVLYTCAIVLFASIILYLNNIYKKHN